MAKFVTIGERLSVTAPTVNKAFAARDEEPILKRAKQQLDAGAVYLDVNIGPAENDGEDIMKWAVELLQSNFDNVPLALDTSNKKAIEAGISVYNRSKGKPIVNSVTAPTVNKAFAARDEEPILKRAKQQLDAGAVYLDVNIGPAENDGEDIMKWAVELLQSNFDNVPLALDTSNKKAIEAGISVYNRSKGKPIVNSADAAGRIEYVDLAAANDAIVIALCNGEGIAKDNDERMMYCQTLLERGMEHGMEPTDLWFDPLFLVVKGMQDKQMEVLECIKMFSDMGLNSTGGLSNNSNGMPKNIRPIMDSALVAMAMMQGLTSAIVNPNDLRLMETIKSCDVFKGNTLYADSYLEL